MLNHTTNLLRLQHGAEHLHALGARATAEFLAELADRIGGLPAIHGLLHEYRRISPEMVRHAGGDAFPPRPLRLVPREVRR
jgi:hypothetical protein